MRRTPRIKICAVYGPNVVSIRVVQLWFKRFKSGNFSVKDEVRSGQKNQCQLEKWSKIDILVSTILLRTEC